MKFSFEETDRGLYLIKKLYSVEKPRHGSDISGPYWMLIEIDLQTGKIWWVADGCRKLPRSNRHFIFLPQFSWSIEHYGGSSKISIKGLISKAKVKHPTFPGPILFYSSQPLTNKLDEVSDFLNDVHDYESISACSNPSALSARTKRLLDEGYRDRIEIKNIARKLKTRSAVLSRSFKADFGQPPAFYRKGLRVTVGMYELLMGASPIEAAHLAGYSDLGRFYKQFKSYLKQTPAQYSKKSKNAKKSISK